MDHDYYQILGVSPDATPAAIRAAFARRARVCHPDRGGSHEEMLLVNEAWEVLSDAARRRRYDEVRAGQGGDTVREAAEADRRHARQQAERYPRQWADYEAWLNRISVDFAGARYGNGSGPWALPEVSNSVSGPVFVVVGMAIGALILPQFMGGSGSSWIGMCFGGLAGAWLGALGHKAIGDGLRKPGSPRDQSQPPEDPTRLIIPCERCGQKLRVPQLREDIVVTCHPCGHRFTVQAAKEEGQAMDGSGRRLSVPDEVGCLLLLVGCIVIGNLMNGCTKRPNSPSSELRDMLKKATAK